jgi:two-component system cell cycle response regulator DivK
MSQRRILVVEDNPKNLKLVRDVLTFSGYEVIEASSGEDGVRLAEEACPDLILMDLQLPGIDGLELTRQLKADPETRDIKVIAVTAYAMKGDQDRAFAAGCDDYVTKPIDTRQLPETIARHLQDEELS